jgi:hypothetical protein
VAAMAALSAPSPRAPPPHVSGRHGGAAELLAGGSRPRLFFFGFLRAFLLPGLGPRAPAPVTFGRSAFVALVVCAAHRLFHMSPLLRPLHFSILFF